MLTLLNWILNISFWSSKNFKKSSTKRLLCDTCGNLQPTDGMRQVFGGIQVCSQCIDKIVLSYVSLNPIKTLCPFCYGKEGNKEQCQYCDIKQIDNI